LIWGLFLGSFIWGGISDVQKEQRIRYSLLAFTMFMLAVVLTIIRYGNYDDRFTSFMVFCESFLFYGSICMWYRVIMDLGIKIELKHNIRCLG
jgi:hypothetical protein